MLKFFSYKSLSNLGGGSVSDGTNSIFALYEELFSSKISLKIFLFKGFFNLSGDN